MMMILRRRVAIITMGIYFRQSRSRREVILKLQPDKTPDGLAFLDAEIENRTVLEIGKSSKIKIEKLPIVHYDGPDLRGVDCGFIYNPKYFKVLESKSIRVNLKQMVKDWRPTRDVLYVKGVLAH